MFRQKCVFMPCLVVKECVDPKTADVMAIDDISAQSFCRNDAGWTRNEFAAAMKAQTLEEYTRAIARLNLGIDLTKDKGLPKGLTNDQVIALVRPRYAQSYTELQQYADAISSLGFVRERDQAFVDSLVESESAGDDEQGNNAAAD